eukprot:2344338-Pleurochrysis_carterae.AAC.2
MSPITPAILTLYQRCVQFLNPVSYSSSSLAYFRHLIPAQVKTTRGMLGTQTLYAPGEVRLWPKFMPTQARGSMRGFE